MSIILTDIEGTTSSVAFVLEVLFPFAAKHLPDFLRQNADQPEVAAQIQAVRDHEGQPDLDLEGVITALLGYIRDDKKVTPLKTLQGLVWAAGYASGELKGHIYEDAVAGLRRWKDEGFTLYVYSSGSVAAQKLLFGHTDWGDLQPLFSGYFDTQIGGKLEAQSYQNILAEIDAAAADVLFLSDNPKELVAAKEAGLWVARLERDGPVEDAGDFPVFTGFDDLSPERLLAGDLT